MHHTEEEQKRKMLHAIRALRSRLESQEFARTEPIAILGLGCRFPGGVEGPDDFWALLDGGVDAITEVPAERWDVDAYYHPDPDRVGKIHTRFGGFIDNVWSFDAAHFGISPREATNLDPQQRLLLEVAWQALEHAGLDSERLNGSNTGVYLGICTADHLRLAAAAGATDGYLATGNMMSVPPGRLAYFFGFQGPALAIDTACSSSLVALHQACAALRAGECNLALAGGVNLLLAPDLQIGLSKARMLAADGRCRTFDAGASGYIRSEGCTVLVLKRLSEAREHGDRILALVRGSAVNQDGRSSGLTAPNGPAQEAVIRAALAAAGVAPTDVDCIEAHGTGTPLGDPIEVAALNRVYGADRSPERPIWLSSVKTNIGHTEACAGLAGVAKLVLALNAERLPAHLHFREPNPLIDWAATPLKVPVAPQPWQRGTRPRLAAVSSFGFSGTNCHAILEEAPPPRVLDERTLPAPFLLPLSARTEVALRQLAARHQAFLTDNSRIDLTGYCAEVAGGRTGLAMRALISADDRQGLIAQLQHLAESGQAVHRGQLRDGARPRLALLFTGQGSQYHQMGRELYLHQPIFRAALQECDRLLQPQLERSLLEALYGDEELDINDTFLAQPLLFAIEYAIAMLWRGLGLEPELVLGHSVGEFAAAVVAGVFSLEDGALLIAGRARLMAGLPAGGGMLSVRCTEPELRAALQSFPTLVLAVENGPRDLVAAGPLAPLENLAQALRQQGIACTRLPVSHAFHSPAMDPILIGFRMLLAGVVFQRPRLTVISSATGEIVDAELATPDYWLRQLREPVRFAQAARSLIASGCEVAIECGPKPQLLGLVDADAPLLRLPSLHAKRPDCTVFQESLGRAFLAGLPVRFRAFFPPRSERPIAPLYPFQRSTYRLPAASRPVVDPGGHPMLGQRHQQARPSLERCYDARISRAFPAFLGDHHILHTVIVPATSWLDMAVAAGRELLGGAVTLEDATFPRALELGEHSDCHLQFSLVPGDHGDHEFAVFSREAGSGGSDWMRHAEGRLAPCTRPAPRRLFDWSAAIEAPGRLLEPATFYRRMDERGYHLGPSFQGVRALWIGAEETLAQIRVPAEVAGEVHRYALHPVLLDACLQSSVAAFFEEPDENFLPYAVERLHYYSPMPELFYCASRRRPEVGGELRCVVLEIFDPEGHAIASVEGLFLKRASSERLQTRRAEQLDDWLHAMRWRPQALAPATTADTSGLLVVGASTLAQDLRAAAIASGRQVAADEPSAPAQLLRRLREQGFPLTEVVLCADQSAPTALESTQAAAVEAACRHLLDWIQALLHVYAEALPRLTAVTRAAATLESDSAPDFVHAPWWAMLRSLRHEHPHWPVRLVDLAPLAREDEGRHLLAELAAERTEDHVAYRDERLVARLQRYGRERTATALTFRADASYLITGGLGGLGRLLAEFLISHGARKLVLTGRAGAKPSDRAYLQALAEQGAEVVVCAADAADRAAMAAAVAQAESLAPLRGVFHAAGVLRDALAHDLDSEALTSVLAPKVAGGLILHELCAGRALDHFVLFSSIAALLGSAAQLNYAAANGFLDALALARAQQRLAATSIHWGPWSEAGMAADHTASWARKGVAALAPAQGLALLERLLAEAPTLVCAAHIDWPLYLQHHELRPRFAELTAPSNAPVAVDIAAQLREAPEHRRLALLESFVGTSLVSILGLPSDTAIDPRTGFFELGLDSLTSMELRNGLQRALGLALPATIAFNYGNLAELCGYLAARLFPAPTADPAPAPPPPRASAAPAIETTTALEAMDLDDLAALLAAELNGD